AERSILYISSNVRLVINSNSFSATSLPISNVGCLTTLVCGVDIAKNGESSMETTLTWLEFLTFFNFKNLNISINDKSFTAKNASGKAAAFHNSSNSLIIMFLSAIMIQLSNSFKPKSSKVFLYDSTRSILGVIALSIDVLTTSISFLPALTNYSTASLAAFSLSSIKIG